LQQGLPFADRYDFFRASKREQLLKPPHTTETQGIMSLIPQSLECGQ
jgi:hypothetical protein